MIYGNFAMLDFAMNVKLVFNQTPSLSTVADWGGGIFPKYCFNNVTGEEGDKCGPTRGECAEKLYCKMESGKDDGTCQKGNDEGTKWLIRKLVMMRK